MKRVLITGATGDIAQALVARLRSQYQLILVGRSLDRLKALYGEEPGLSLYQVDMTQESSIRELLDVIAREEGPIDILINNAGYGVYGPFEDFQDREVKEMFQANVFAAMTFCRILGKEMKRRQSGQIINLVSMSGHIATSQSSVYSATKFALMGFSNSIRLELAPYQVYVTTVNTGPVATKFFRKADPDGSYQENIRGFLMTPDKVAAKIVPILGRRKRELNLPFALKGSYVFYRLFPGLSDFLSRTLFNFKSSKERK